MTIPRSALIISAIALILLALIPAVSANEIIIDEDLSEYVDTSASGVNYYEDLIQTRSGVKANKISFTDITKAKTLSYLVFELPDDYGRWLDDTKIEEGRYDFTYNFNGADRPGVLYLNRKTNLLGQVTSTQFTLFLNDWDIGDLTGEQTVTCPFYFNEGTIVIRAKGITNETNARLSDVLPVPVQVTEVTAIMWEHHLTVEHDLTSYFINIDGVIDDEHYTSQVNLWKDDEIYATFTNPGKELSRAYLKTDINLIEIISPSGTVYSYPLESDIPDGPHDQTVTVYIKNSQTGALIANANVVIDALVDGEYYPVTNRTEPSGIFSINLQPTGGGQPNPDGYRLIATADGYNNPMPEINFTVDDSKNYIYCLLDPIAGGPVNENKTFIDFFVRDMSANPVSGATVKFDKYTLITNSAGYTVFEVDKNKNYSWTVSKSGYGSLTGNAVIGSDARYTINTGIDPVVTPTKPTPIPTSTPISPTPTMTAPTGESVSNWLEWFAAHFGMILGGGVEIGKIFMWLCFTVPVGVYVGKEAKAGAAGFMAGAGIVTLFFVLIGWVPIWLLVLLALIIGLLYAKEFNTSDNGGGR